MLDRLPYEIFRQITRQSLDVHDARFTFYDSDGLSPLPPIKMSHVCRSWRTALLSDPTMWTFINIPEMRPDQITEFLRRSCSAPLRVVVYAFIHSVRLDLSNWRFQTTTLAPIFQHIHRFQSLELSFPQGLSQPMTGWLRHILRNLDQSAPELEKLSLAIQPNGNRDILKTLFSGNTPCLKHIHHQIITGFAELLPSPLFRNLANLHLDLINFGTITIDYDSLLNVLELSPGLRVFRLATVVDSKKVSFHLPTSPDRRVHLPCLQSLRLLGDPKAEMTDILLGRLTFPINVHYHIDAGNLQRRNSNLTSLIQFLAQRCHPSLSISADSLSPTSIHIAFESHSNGKESSFGTSYDCKYEPMNRLPSFLQIFKLSDIVHLHLHSLPLKTHVLRKLFMGLVNLEHLVIEHDIWPDRSWAEKMYSTPLTAFLTALMPLPLVPREKNDGFDPNQNTTYEPDDLMNSDNILLPCPSLSTMEIIFGRCLELRLDEHYANLIAVCCSVRRNVRHPYKHISIRSPPGILTPEAEKVFLYNKDCPIDISTNAIEMDD